VCIRGDLAGEAERLTEEITKVSRTGSPTTSRTDTRPGRSPQQLKEAREQVRAAEEPFTLRYIGDKAYSDLLAAHPSEDDNELFDSVTFPRALVSASCVEPR
jgi:hypothetical protein